MVVALHGLLYLAAVRNDKPKQDRQDRVDTGTDRFGYTYRNPVFIARCLPRGGLMPRSMVGLLAAAGTAMSACVAFAHGFLICVAIAVAAAAVGLAAYLALLPQQEATSSALPQEEAASSACQVIKKNLAICKVANLHAVTWKHVKLLVATGPGTS
jgi:hypothetical protein